MTFAEAGQIMISGRGVIKSLTVTKNGTYTAPAGVDGYSPVSVGVPDRYSEGYNDGHKDGYKDGYNDGFQYANDVTNGKTTPTDVELPDGSTITFPNGYIGNDNADGAKDTAMTFTGSEAGENTGTAVNLDNGYKLVVYAKPFDGTFGTGSSSRSFLISIITPEGYEAYLASSSSYPSFYDELVDFEVKDGRCNFTYIKHRPDGTSTTLMAYSPMTGDEIRDYNNWATGTNYGCGVGTVTHS